jgi:hypothetical protein
LEKAVALIDQIGSIEGKAWKHFQPLLVGFREEMYPYSDEQLGVMKTHTWPHLRPRSDERSRGKVMVTYRDGLTESVPGSALLARGRNQFTGWTCFIGLELITIDSNGRIFRGVCHEGGAIGTANDGLSTIPTAPVVCSRSSCWCLADIPVEKYSPSRSL